MALFSQLRYQLKANVFLTQLELVKKARPSLRIAQLRSAKEAFDKMIASGAHVAFSAEGGAYLFQVCSEIHTLIEPDGNQEAIDLCLGFAEFGLTVANGKPDTSPSSFKNPAVIDTAKQIIDCVGCDNKLRIPRLRGTIKVRCPDCQSEWEVYTGKPTTTA